MAEHIQQRVVIDNRPRGVRCGVDLGFGVEMPSAHLLLVLVRSLQHLLVRVGAAEPCAPRTALALQRAGVVELNADGEPVQLAQAEPTAVAGMPSDTIERNELRNLAITRDDEVSGRFVSPIGQRGNGAFALLPAV